MFIILCSWKWPAKFIWQITKGQATNISPERTCYLMRVFDVSIASQSGDLDDPGILIKCPVLLHFTFRVLHFTLNKPLFCRVFSR